MKNALDECGPLLLAVSVSLAVSAFVWIIQDWINAILNELPITVGEFSNAVDAVVTALAIPVIILFNLLILPAFLLEGVCKVVHAGSSRRSMRLIIAMRIQASDVSDRAS